MILMLSKKKICSYSQNVLKGEVPSANMKKIEIPVLL